MLRNACVVGLFVVCLSGCIDLDGAVRTRAANDFGCAERDVEIANISEKYGEHRFHAQGCGKKGVYNCAADATCAAESVPQAGSR
jgi:hypothetical protein